jgi:hypothetical protein
MLPKTLLTLFGLPVLIMSVPDEDNSRSPSFALNTIFVVFAGIINSRDLVRFQRHKQQKKLWVSNKNHKSSMNKRHTISLPTKINNTTCTVAGLDYAIVDINKTLKR